VIRVAVSGELLCKAFGDGYSTGGELRVENGLPPGCRLVHSGITPGGNSVAFYFAEPGEDAFDAYWRATVGCGTGGRDVTPLVRHVAVRS
jgi:hypothetical protein